MKIKEKDGLAELFLKALDNPNNEKITHKQVNSRNKNNDSESFNQSCEQIKKLGKQKDFCESKFLLSEGELKTVECLKTFCNTCCESKSNCIETCQTAHSLYSSNDPEELLMDVCSYESMRTSFHGFCQNMLAEKNNSEYDECFKNFCFDCCSNKLNITDIDDPAINKCMKICVSPYANEEKVILTQENNLLLIKGKAKNCKASLYLNIKIKNTNIFVYLLMKQLFVRKIILFIKC